MGLEGFPEANAKGIATGMQKVTQRVPSGYRVWLGRLPKQVAIILQQASWFRILEAEFSLLVSERAHGS